MQHVRVELTCKTLCEAGVPFMAPLTMIRVDKISCSRRGTMPARASWGRYATPLAAITSLQPQHPVSNNKNDWLSDHKEYADIAVPPGDRQAGMLALLYLQTHIM